jgi:large subunit ribosomal protein L4
MASVKVRTVEGKEGASVELPDAIFGIEPNVPVMHQVVTAQLAARRRGTHSTKTRAEVRGGGAKPWRQKGTGRARAGSSRSPIWRGGGVALGPKPRDYSQRTPRKMVRLALRSALSDRAADGKVVVVDEWGFSVPRTKDAVAALGALGVEGKALVVLDPEDVVTWKSFRNLPHVHLIETGQLNAYDVLCSDVVIFTSSSLPGATEAEEAAPSESTLARRETVAEKQAARRAEADKKAAVAEKKAAATVETADEPAPAKKKVVKKKIIKKVVKKKAPAADAGAADAGAAEGGEALPPRMKPGADTAEAPATDEADAPATDDEGAEGGAS